MYVNKGLTKRKMWMVGILSASLVLMVSFQNCSAVRSANGDTKMAKSLSEQDLLGKQAMEILSAKCLTCHNPDNAKGGISDITDLNSLLYYRLVIPGQPEISDIIRVIKEGSMPPSGGISNTELSALNTWILDGLLDDSGNVTLPPSSNVLEAKYSSIKIRIFNTKCVGCHSGANPPKGVDLTTYAATTTASIAIAGNANGSRVVQSVERPGADFMPRNGSRLTAEEIKAIRDWITAGAMNN